MNIIDLEAFLRFHIGVVWTGRNTIAKERPLLVLMHAKSLSWHMIHTIIVQQSEQEMQEQTIASADWTKENDQNEEIKWER